MHPRVVRKVDGDGLAAGIGVAGIVDGVIHEHVRLGAGNEGLVLLRARELFLKVRKHGDVLGEFICLLEILEEDEALIGGLDSVDAVLVVLDRADDKVHLAVLHIHPGKVGLIIVVSPEGFRTLEKIVPDTLLDGHCRSRLKVAGNLVDALGILLVIPYCLELSVLSPPDEGIRVELERVVECVELLPGHVFRVEAGPGRALAITSDERGIVVKPVPRTVIDHRIGPLRALRKCLENGLVPE